MPADEAEARRAIAGTIQELWGSDEVRAASPTPLDEVHAGLVYFASTLHRVVPELYRELEAAVEECLPGRGDRGAAAADVRLAGWAATATATRTSRPRSPRRRSSMMRDQLPAPARGADRAAGPARVALATGSSGARTSSSARAGRGSPSCFPERGRRGLAPQPRGALPALLLARRRARARDAPRATPSGYAAPGRAARRPARSPSARCATGRASSSRRPSCTTRSARSRCSASTSPGSTSASTPAATATRSPRCCPRSACTRPTRRWRRPSASRCWRARSRERRPLIPSDLSGVLAPRRRRSSARSASLGEPAARARTRARSSPTSSPAPRSRAHLLEVLLLMKESGLADGRRRGRAAADRAAVRGRGVARAGRRDDARAARAAGLPRPRCARSATSRR